MTRHLFAKGSLEDRAFQEVLRLPPYVAPDWGAAGQSLADNGELPKSEQLFPDAAVQRWFAIAGRLVSGTGLEVAGPTIEVAYYQLTAVEMLEQMTSGLSLRRREKSGPDAAFKETLARLAKGAKAVSETLGQIRGEILYRKASASTVEWLTHVLNGLDEEFWWGVHKANLLHSLVQDDQPVFKDRQSGRDVSMAPRALEQGCADLATLAERLALDPALSLPPASKRAKADRRGLFEAAMEAWSTATGDKPTLSGRDDQLARAQLSGFHKFYCQVVGHSAGLVVRVHFPEWSAGEVEGAAEALRRLGLDQLSTVSTLRRWMKKSAG